MKLDEQNVIAHLKYIYGYEANNDSYLIKHIIDRTKDLIRNFCHRSDIPEGAVHPAIEYVCGCFLLHKINTGTLTDEEGNPLYSFSAPETSVKMGDVTVNYEDGYGSLTDDNGFLSMVTKAANENHFKLELTHFRKVKWR